MSDNLTITIDGKTKYLKAIRNDHLKLVKELLYEYYYLNGTYYSIEEKPEPLFTTTDNVDIYEGDEYWYVSNWIVNKHCKMISAVGISSDLKYFSTEQAAKDYVRDNKPKFSVNDFIQACNKRDFVGVYYIVNILREL